MPQYHLIIIDRSGINTQFCANLFSLLKTPMQILTISHHVQIHLLGINFIVRRRKKHRHYILDTHRF